MDNKFLVMRKEIYNFAQNLYFRNEVAINLVEKDEQKDLLHFDRSGVEKLQEIISILNNFCQPQIINILQDKEKDIKVNYNLLQDQAHQLIQNFSNLEKLIAYTEEQAKRKNRNLSKQWLELKENLAKMNVDQIKDIEKTSKSMS